MNKTIRGLLKTYNFQHLWMNKKQICKIVNKYCKPMWNGNFSHDYIISKLFLIELNKSHYGLMN